MKTKTHIYLSISLILLACIVLPAYALSDSDYQVRSFNNFQIYTNGTAILFGIDSVDYNYVALQPTSGTWNATNCNLWMAANYGGHLSFTSNSEVTLLLTTSIDNVKFDNNPYTSGRSYTFPASGVHTIEWSYTLNPYLPFGLILGILGACFLLIGPMYLIYKFRHHEYSGLVTGVVITIIGIAFIIGWLW